MTTASRSPGFVKAEPYNWPHDAPLDPKTTALVIIDMQNDFCSIGGYMTAQGIDITPTLTIIPRIRTLLAAFRTFSYPIYHTREGHRADLSTLSSREQHRSRLATGHGIGDAGPMGRHLVRGSRGHDIIDELAPREGEPVIDKPGRSAFAYTDFKLLLDNRGLTKLVLCGVTTDVCVATTMRQANDLGLECVVVGDACAAAEEGLHRAALDMVKMEGGIFGAVTSVEDVLTAVREVSGAR